MGEAISDLPAQLTCQLNAAGGVKEPMPHEVESSHRALPKFLTTETWTIINGGCFKPLHFGWFVIQQHITDKVYPNPLFLFLRNGRSQDWAFYPDSQTCERPGRPGLTRSVSTYLHVPNKGDLTSLKATALTPKYYQWISLEDVVIGNCLHFSIFLELAKIASIMRADMP